ncbi:hypothetical protein [Mycobacterium sp.]|nr:hypothetical protein [Mycobacterium sp.]
MTDPTPPRPVRQAVIGICVLAVWHLIGVIEVQRRRWHPAK